MKKIFLVIAFLCAAFCASAQYADPQLKVKRGHMYADGVKLDDAQVVEMFSRVDMIYGTDVSGEYMINREKYNTGRWLNIGSTIGFVSGTVLGYVGLLSCFVGITSRPIGQACLYSAIPLYFGSIGCGIAGGIMTRRSMNNMKIMAADYNAMSGARQPELTFGPTQNGVGFALSF